MRFLSNYLDFIFEAVAKKEMRLYYSDEFRKLLDKVSKNNKYAKFLLSAEDSNQITDIYTLVDITDKNDTISFIQVNRILRSNPDTKTYPNDDVYFLPRNITNDKSNEFWNKGRTEISIGRWLRRIVTEVHKSSITDSDIETFVNQYKAAVDGDINNFELVNGEDIKKWYHENNYLERRGQLGNSCMRYNSCQNFLDIYVKNPEVCQLLILKSEDNKDKITGRALIWKLTDDSYFMDRIYTINDSDRLLFNDFFEKWMIKNSYRVSDENTHYLEVKLGDHTYEKYPYMDTFVVYNPTTKILRDDEDLWPGQGYIKIQDTSGGFEEDDGIWSEWYGEHISREGSVWCENINSYVYTDDATYLDYKDEWAYPNEDVVWSEYHSENFYKDDAVYSEVMNDYLYPDNEQVIEVEISKNDTDWLVKSRTDLYIEQIIVGETKYFLRKSYIKDPYTGEYHFIDEKENRSDTMTWGDLLYHKIREELFPGDDCEHRELVQKVKKKLYDSYKSGELNTKEVISSIESNEVYVKSLKNVYWGMDSSELLTPGEMIPSLLASITFTESFLSTSSKISLFTSEIEKVTGEGDLNLKYKKMMRLDYRYIRALYKMNKSFDYSSFGKEIEKLYLLLTL
jgi:hypothetical protein